MSGEAERAATIRAEQQADEWAALHELLVARLSEAMDAHGQVNGAASPSTRGHCECGYVEPYGLGIGLHQLEAAAAELIPVIHDRADRLTDEDQASNEQRIARQAALIAELTRERDTLRAFALDHRDQLAEWATARAGTETSPALPAGDG